MAMSGWRPQQCEPNRAEKCASPDNDYRHMPPWNRRDGWCPLCGQYGISEPSIWYAFHVTQQRIAELEGILQRIVDNEVRLEGQVAIHSSLRGKKEALADARTILA